jgi:hypothetical protein
MIAARVPLPKASRLVAGSQEYLRPRTRRASVAEK